ncbi:hypothetical protein HDV01_001159 [Terramyces sp. JEL0728]|nr:hypothetical protein HDV01_001159 [Terramyces sp. JEL0728]
MSIGLLILYVLSVLVTGLLALTSLAHTKIFHSLKNAQQLAIISSIVTEYSVYILSSKLMMLYEMDSSYFDSTIMTIIYRLDIVITLSFWAFFLQSVFSRHPIYEQTKFMRNETSTIPPSIFTVSFWFRFNNPFWDARNILFQDNILYATEQEVLEASKNSPRAKTQLSLDIHQHPSFPRNRPVVIYIHGGNWKEGSKEERPPLVSYLTLKKYVLVSINHRLAPFVDINEQLIDVKRAIRWTRQNIHKFGGDPSFIAICGGSSGAHLATMAAFTQNEKRYQPGFEDVDTSIQAVVSLGGYFDVTHSWGYKFESSFRKSVAKSEDMEVSRRFSPTWILKEAEANKTRVAATEEDKLGPVFPPMMIIHGKNDSLAPIKHVRDFKKEFSIAAKKGSHITYIELPCANHYFYRWSSPRSHTLAYGIEPFIRSFYEKHLEAVKSQ